MTDEIVPHLPRERADVRRLVSSLRARGGIGSVSAACHIDVPEVDGVVLSVHATDAGQVTLSDSGPLGDQLEDLHAHAARGPAVDASATGAAVTVDDLQGPAARAQWPRFATEASAVGIGAVFAYPVLVGGLPVGVLSLYRSTAGALSPSGQAWARRYCEAAAVMLRDDASDTGPDANLLPVYAAEIQQAVGIVMELAGVDAVTALHRLRAYSLSSARPMPDVVAEVRTCRLPFDPSASA